jgi:hypothetical protein
VSGEGFVAIYRWRVAPEKERLFRQRWHDVTKDIRDHYGGLGSCLTRDETGAFVGVALWRSREARDAAFAARGEPPPEAGIEMIEEVRLTGLDDLWLRSGFEA